MSIQRARSRAVETPGLRRISVASGSATQDPNIDIILVPEYGSGINFPAPAWQWISDFREGSSVIPQVLVFDYKPIDGDQSFWQGIGNAGIALLQALERDRAQFGIAQRPFVFIAHGLGGVVLKQAISDLHQQEYNPEAHRLITMHAGDVLLGTPHLIPANVHRRAQQVRNLLKSSVKLRKTRLDQAMGELSLLAAISGRFEQASIRTRVLNVYEAKQTKLKWGPFSNKEILVDRDFAQIGVSNEVLIGADVSHATLAEVDADSEVHREYTQLLNNVVSNPPTFDFPGQEQEDDISHAPWSSVYGDQSQDLTPSPFYSTQQSALTQDTDDLPPAHGPSTSRKPQIPCHVLEPHVRDPDFIGRDDIIRTLADALIPSDKDSPDDPAERLRAVAITGMGGIGKTSIAAEFAFRYQKKFDSTFIVQADSQDIMAQDFARMAFRLGLVDKADAGNSVVGQNVLMQWLTNPEKTERQEGGPLETTDQCKWLLIFDNADDLEVLKDYWPVDGIGSVIVTSRNPDADRTRFYSIQNLKVDQMTINDATSMLFRITKYPNTSQNNLQASTLASRLDGLPLALQQISSYLRRKDLNFAEVLDLLDDETAAKRLHAASERSGHTLATVWASKAIDRPSCDLLQVLAYLDPDSIPEFIFKPSRPVWPGRGDSFYSNEMSYVDARTLLHRYSLIKRNRDLGLLSIHRLVQDASRFVMDEETSQMQFELAIRLVRQAWPSADEDFMHDATLWPQQEQVARQVSNIHDIFERHPRWQMSDEARVKLAEVLAKCSWYHQERANFDMAKRMLDLPLSIASARPDAMMPLLADVYFQKAWTAAEMMDGDTTLKYAQKHFHTRLELERATKPALTQSSAMAYSILALAYLLCERYADVAPIIEEGLAIYNDAPETDKNVHWPHFFIIHHAWALVGLGRADEAVGMLEETVAWGAMRLRKTGYPSFKHAYALQTLASVNFLLGKYEESFNLNQRSYRFYQETVGTNMHHVGDVCTKLAECKSRQSQPELALPFVKKAVKVYGHYTYYKAQLARALFIQGNIQEKVGDHSLAEDSRQRATDLYLEVTGKGFSEGKALDVDNFTSIVPVWAR